MPPPAPSSATLKPAAEAEGEEVGAAATRFVEAAAFCFFFFFFRVFVLSFSWCQSFLLDLDAYTTMFSFAVARSEGRAQENGGFRVSGGTREKKSSHANFADGDDDDERWH